MKIVGPQHCLLFCGADSTYQSLNNSHLNIQDMQSNDTSDLAEYHQDDRREIL